MILIAHRGNIDGIVKEKENKPSYLREALEAGYDIEVDIRLTPDGWFLGHDGPEHKIDERFFEDFDPVHVWYHAKNAAALAALHERPTLNYFWIDNDEFALTSKGYIWVHTRTQELPAGSICVLPEVRKSNAGMLDCAGICTDYVTKYAKTST